MKIVIDIPDEAYNELIKEQHLPNDIDVEYFIIHGKPLPMGKCGKCEYYRNNYGYGQCFAQKNAPRVDYNHSCENFKSKAKEVERPTGEWLFDAEHSFTIDLYKCSVCGSGGHVHFKYCPTCGAKMKGEQS